jgi:hypothetical protein
VLKHSFPDTSKALFGLAAMLLFAHDAVAAPHAVERFDAATWPHLKQSLPRPAAVVFTTTDCIYCPAVIARLASEVKRRHIEAPVVAVVMDSDESTLVRDPHYRPADRLLAFDGQAPALRYAVDPAWRGMTPYVAFFGLNDSITRVTGSPSDAQIDAWIGAASK